MGNARLLLAASSVHVPRPHLDARGPGNCLAACLRRGNRLGEHMINNWKNKRRANHGAFWRQDVWAENNPEARRWEHVALPEKDSTLEALSTPQPGARPPAMFEDGVLPEEGDGKHEAGVMTTPVLSVGHQEPVGEGP